MLFPLLRRERGDTGLEELVNPICFSEDAQNYFIQCPRPVVITITGRTGFGKSCRLNQLIKGVMKAKQPFRSQGGRKGTTRDFEAWGPVNLSDFCRLWKIPMTSPEEYELFFVDSEGTGNAAGVDANLGKALAVVSSVTTVRITLDRCRPSLDSLHEIDAALKLQCLKRNRNRATETSSALVLISADVGFEDPPPESFEEAENRRHAQDAEAAEMMIQRYPTHGFTAENLCVLLQPNTGGYPEDFEKQSYMESLRDLARFIDCACRTRRPAGFAWMNSILTSVAGVIGRLPRDATIDITEALQAVYRSWADDVFKGIIEPAPLHAQAELAHFSIRDFPYGNALNPRFVADAIAAFDANCIALCETIFDDIPDKADRLRQDLRHGMQEAWSRQWTARRQVLVLEMLTRLTRSAEKLASQARNDATRVVSGLRLQIVFDALGPDLFYRPVIDAKVAELRRLAQELHPHCLDLIGDRFDIMQRDLDESVQTAVAPHWRDKKIAAQKWNEDRANEKLEAELQRQAAELQRKAEQREQQLKREKKELERRAKAEKDAQELRRKRDRPESLSELMNVKGVNWDPVGEVFWLYPGGLAPLKFQCSSYSPCDSRLQLIHPGGLSAELVRVSITRGPDGGSVWNPVKRSVPIPLYIDGHTMGIVFTSEPKVGADQAIYINLPPDTEIENLPYCGHYRPFGNDRRVVHTRTGAGTHNRGPRIQSDHNW
jgi:hypothetical protein